MPKNENVLKLSGPNVEFGSFSCLKRHKQVYSPNVLFQNFKFSILAQVAEAAARKSQKEKRKEEKKARKRLSKLYYFELVSINFKMNRKFSSRF